MKRVIFTVIVSILAWLSYLNIHPFILKMLTACIYVKLFTTLLAIVLSFIVQKLITNNTGSILVKDNIEELANCGSIYTKTTKTLLILFIFFCLFRCGNIILLWIYASSQILDEFLYFYWDTFVEKIK